MAAGTGRAAGPTAENACEHLTLAVAIEMRNATLPGLPHWTTLSEAALRHSVIAGHQKEFRQSGSRASFPQKVANMSYIAELLWAHPERLTVEKSPYLSSHPWS